MSETAPKAELMRSLGRLVRGLSAIFWGLPIALVVCAQTATTNWLLALAPFGLVAQVAVTSMLLYGLWLMGDFQKQERVWLLALDRAKVLGLVNVGLSPFLHWHQQMPDGGTLAIVYVQATDRDAHQRFATSDAEISRWFVQQMQEVHGRDVSQPPLPVELILDVRVEGEDG